MIKHNDLFNNIIKKHDYYEAKFKIINSNSFSSIRNNEVNTKKINFLQTKSNASIGSKKINGLQMKIMQSKKKIEEFKKQQLNEEQVLLSLYKLNK